MLAECDSDETIAAVGHALQERHQVVFIESDDKAYGRLKRQRPHLVFNIAERVVGPNRESHIPTVCEMLDVPYTGSDPLTLGICLDKSRAKEILTYHRVPNPAFWIIESAAAIPAGVRLPAIVKPLYEGSSKGIKNNSLVREPRRALRARRGGRRDLQAAGHRRAVPRRPRVHRRRPGERPELRDPAHRRDRPRAAPRRARRPIYSYEAKWLWDTREKPLDIFKCPAPVSGVLRAKIENVVARTCSVLRIRDWCRVDVRLDEKGEPNILEVNPLPGILPRPEDNSCLPKAARTAGYSYSDLIHRVVEEASKRCGLRQTRIRPASSDRPAVLADRA